MHASRLESIPAARDALCRPAAGAAKPIRRYDGRGLTKLAVMCGAYGNIPALEASLAHARAAGCDGFVFLGDATGCCGHSDETIAIVRAGFPFLLAGNYEQKAAAGDTDCGCNYSDPEDTYYGGIAHEWAMRSLNDDNRRWLATWPDLAWLDTRVGRILLCHGSPVQTNEFLYESELDETRLAGWLHCHHAVGLACGHTGFPWSRSVAGGRFALNCGACGKPDHDHDPAVHYASIDLAEQAGSRVMIERVEYEHLGWADRLYREGVDDVFTIPIRNGVWTCGLMSMPATERLLRPRPPGWLAATGEPRLSTI